MYVTQSVSRQGGQSGHLKNREITKDDTGTRLSPWQLIPGRKLYRMASCGLERRRRVKAGSPSFCVLGFVSLFRIHFVEMGVGTECTF